MHGWIVGHDEVGERTLQEGVGARQHPVFAGVAVDQRLHRIDVRGPGGPDRRGADHRSNAILASPSASRTRAGAVPPGDVRARSERSMSVSAGASSPKRGSCRRSSATVRPARSRPAARRSLTIRPTIPCASRNGTPWRTRVVREVGRGEHPALGGTAHLHPVEGEALEDQRKRIQRRCDRRRIVQGDPLLLKVTGVGQRQPFQGGEDRDEIADDPSGPPPHELGDVRILLLRHDARAGRVRVAERGEPELAPGP